MSSLRARRITAALWRRSFVARALPRALRGPVLSPIAHNFALCIDWGHAGKAGEPN
jgi:hypothetical protein